MCDALCSMCHMCPMYDVPFFFFTIMSSIASTIPTVGGRTMSPASDLIYLASGIEASVLGKRRAGGGCFGQDTPFLRLDASPWQESHVMYAVCPLHGVHPCLKRARHTVRASHAGCVAVPLPCVNMVWQRSVVVLVSLRAVGRPCGGPGVRTAQRHVLANPHLNLYDFPRCAVSGSRRTMSGNHSLQEAKPALRGRG